MDKAGPALELAVLECVSVCVCVCVCTRSISAQHRTSGEERV